jgi:chromate reductase, NAD(P)H dehydrogenase (quinone)
MFVVDDIDCVTARMVGSRAELLRAPAQHSTNVDLTIWDALGKVPLFNKDLESGPVLEAVADMGEVIDRSDALLIVTPEYNQSIPGVLKNALDWASRPYGQTVLRDKPVAAVGTSPLPTGGACALADVRKVITLLGADVIEAELTVPQVHTRFNATGLLCDPQLEDQMDQLLIRIADHEREILRPRFGGRVYPKRVSSSPP